MLFYACSENTFSCDDTKKTDSNGRNDPNPTSMQDSSFVSERRSFPANSKLTARTVYPPSASERTTFQIHPEDPAI